MGNGRIAGVTGPGGSGDYFEVGYTYSIEDPGVDLGVTFVYSPDLVVGSFDDGETGGDSALTFSIKKTFGLGE